MGWGSVVINCTLIVLHFLFGCFFHVQYVIFVDFYSIFREV